MEDRRRRLGVGLTCNLATTSFASDYERAMIVRGLDRKDGLKGGLSRGLGLDLAPNPRVVVLDYWKSDNTLWGTALAWAIAATPT